MSIQQFCLRWNNHQPNFISVFTTLLNNESLVDVTLAAEGKHLQAHKVVLSACSVYFQTLFTANPSRHPIVILKDVKYADLRIMVDFMYYGEVNVSQEQLPQILETAKMLKIKGLTEMPDSTSLTKAQSTSSERADLLTPGESSWGSDTQQRHSISPCNLSPSMKRKRLRKTSTGSGSTSIEKSAEDKHFIDHSGATLNLVKTDSITLSSVPQHSVKIKTKELQYSDFQTSKESLDENGGVDNSISLNTDESNCLMRGVEPALDDPASNLSQQGPQWTMLEQGYPRYTTPTCHTNAHQNTSSSTLNNIQTQESSVPPFNVPLMNPHINIDICDYQQQQQQHLQPSQTTSDMESCSPGPSCANNINNASTVPETPTNNAPPKRRRTNNPQSEENFQRALEAVRFGGIGFCKAARMFGVNNRTLWLEYKKKGYPNNRPSIKNRIKQEHSSPPPEAREELPVPQEQQLTLLCPPHTVGMMGFIDSRQMDFGNIQNINRPRFGEDNINIHSSPINLHGINFNSMQ